MAWLENQLSEFGTGSAARFNGIDPRTLEGLPVPVRDFIVTPWIPKREGVFIADSPATGITGSIGRRTCEQVFLELLDQVTAENQPVSSNSRAGNYAPKLFVKRPDRDGFVKANFEAAMHKLFAAREIVNIDYGRKHDERKRIVRRS